MVYSCTSLQFLSFGENRLHVDPARLALSEPEPYGKTKDCVLTLEPISFSTALPWKWAQNPRLRHLHPDSGEEPELRPYKTSLRRYRRDVG
jgi:hypothetical protein